MVSPGFTVYSVIMSFISIGLVLLIIFQILADMFGKYKIKDKFTRILLYGMYITGLCCSINGYSIHLSENIPLWCEFYGIPPCFALYGGTKAWLLAFFLIRAKHAAGTMNKWKKLAFERVGPVYVIVYWIAYALLAATLFTGKPVKDAEQVAVSWCLFDSWQWWFVILANTIDVFNSVGSLLLFIYPLIKSLRTLHKAQPIHKKDNKSLIRFVRTMKWNVFLTAIATLSSIITVTAIPLSNEYIWLLCSGDPFINSLCAFLMMGSNRYFLLKQCKKCNYFRSKADKQIEDADSSSNKQIENVQNTDEKIHTEHSTNTTNTIKSEFIIPSTSPNLILSNTESNRKSSVTLLTLDPFSRSAPLPDKKKTPPLTIN